MRIYDNRISYDTDGTVIKGDIIKVEYLRADCISERRVTVTLDTGYSITIPKEELDQIIQAYNKTEEA